jgi:hypothetical protein
MAAAGETMERPFIIQYSERSLAVLGDSRTIKESLKELGGKFNKFETSFDQLDGLFLIRFVGLCRTRENGDLGGFSH